MKYLYWVAAAFPFALSVIFYSRLPDRMAIHWNAAGEANGYASRPVAAFGIPAFFLLITFLVNFAISADPRKKNIDKSPEMKRISRWIIVIVANLGQSASIMNALNVKVNVSFYMLFLMGILFVILGNYLPKCKYNYTIGIKLPWTLADEENWRKTHRFAGFVWMIGGVLISASAFFPHLKLIPYIIATVIAIPTGYSYLLHLKSKKADSDHQ